VHVIATARNPAVLADLGAQGMTTLALDVSKTESIQTCHGEVAQLTAGRGLDILVNNAGRTHTHPATDLDMDDVRETFETNVFGVMAMCAAFADLLIAAKGLIVNVASLAAVTPYVFGSAYCASKGAVVSYSRTLRLELKPFGVRVMVAMAGTVRSNIASRTHRELPEGSIYQRVRELFERRLTFSQNNATVTTGSFAAKLVDRALRSEAPLLFRSWFGRPDWLWAGGFSLQAWLAGFLGEWAFDFFMYRKIGMNQLEQLLQKEAAQKKLA
jgi:1-acylglycerone phosphate reductase